MTLGSSVIVKIACYNLKKLPVLAVMLLDLQLRRQDQVVIKLGTPSYVSASL